MRKIDRTKRDFSALNKCPPLVDLEKSFANEYELQRSIVIKPWGYEYFLAGNESAAAWLLQLNPHESTSLHCHIGKKTVLIVLHGDVAVESLNGVQIHSSGAVIEIAAGAFHRTRVIGNQPAYIIEVESPNRKHDLLRLEDGYGRVGSGYEKIDAFADDLANHDWVHLSELGEDKFVEKFVGLATLRLVRASNPDRVTEFQLANDVVISFSQDAPILTGEGNTNPTKFLKGTFLGISWKDSERPLSHVVADGLASAGIREVFVAVGDSNGHLVESIARHEALKLRVFSDERQAGNAAQGLARFSGSATALIPGSAFGLGAVVQIALDCWFDSVPLVIISTSSLGASQPISGIAMQLLNKNKTLDASLIFSSMIKGGVKIEASYSKVQCHEQLKKITDLASDVPKGPVLVEIEGQHLTEVVKNMN